MELRKLYSKNNQDKDMRFSQFLREDALELALPTDVRSAIIDKGGKIYQPGVEIPCLIEANDFDFNTDEFGSDVEQSVEFRFFREKLIELNFRPEIGDVINWNSGYWEISSINENQLVGGQTDYNHSVVCNSFLVRISNLNIERVRSV